MTLIRHPPPSPVSVMSSSTPTPPPSTPRRTSSKTNRILIVNPNSTQSMTAALKPLINKLNYADTEYGYLTGPPEAPPSINNREDIEESCRATLPIAAPLLPHHSAVLVACYSPHPLVAALQAHTKIPVMGILEASVGAAQQLIGTRGRFGIVSTGKVWEEILGEKIAEMYGGGENSVQAFTGEDGAREEYAGWEEDERLSAVFAGVETTGLNATELHDAPQDEVKKRVQDAVKRLMARRNVKAILLGCAGMSGMDEWVREITGTDVWVIDGVLAGVSALQGIVRGGF